MEQINEQKKNMNKCYFRKYGCKGIKNEETENKHNENMLNLHRQLVNFNFQNYEYNKDNKQMLIKQITNDRIIYYDGNELNKENYYGAYTDFHIILSKGFHFIGNEAILLNKNGEIYGRYPVNNKNDKKHKKWIFELFYYKLANDKIENVNNNDIKDIEKLEIGIKVINSNLNDEEDKKEDNDKKNNQNENEKQNKKKKQIINSIWIINKEMVKEFLKKSNNYQLKFEFEIKKDKNLLLISKLIKHNIQLKKFQDQIINNKYLFFPYLNISSNILPFIINFYYSDNE